MKTHEGGGHTHNPWHYCIIQGENVCILRAAVFVITYCKLLIEENLSPLFVKVTPTQCSKVKSQKVCILFFLILSKSVSLWNMLSELLVFGM